MVQVWQVVKEANSIGRGRGCSLEGAPIVWQFSLSGCHCLSSLNGLPLLLLEVRPFKSPSYRSTLSAELVT